MSRFWFYGVCAFGLLFSQVMAHAADEPQTSVLQNIYSCLDIKQDAARLVCFDAAASNLRVAETAGEVVAVQARELRNIEKEAFGFKLPSLPKLRLFGANKAGAFEKPSDDDPNTGKVIKLSNSGAVAEIEFIIDRIVKQKGQLKNTHLFYLTNGQVWRQADNKYVNYSKKAGVVHKAQIRRRAVSGHFLRINGKGRSIPVKRVR